MPTAVWAGSSANTRSTNSDCNFGSWRSNTCATARSTICCICLLSDMLRAVSDLTAYSKDTTLTADYTELVRTESWVLRYLFDPRR